MPTAKHEENIRRHLLKNFHRREALTEEKSFKKYYGEASSEHFFKTTYKLKQLLNSDPKILEELSPSLKKYALSEYAQSSALAQFPKDAEKVLKQLAYFKDWLFMHSMSDNELCGEQLLEEMASAFRLVLPVLHFLEEAYD